MRFIYQRHTNKVDELNWFDKELFDLVKKSNKEVLFVSLDESKSLLNNKDDFYIGTIEFCEPFYKINDYSGFLYVSQHNFVGELFLNEDGEFSRPEYVKHCFWDIYQDFAKNANVFFKGNGYKKEISGQLVDLKDFSSFIDANLDKTDYLFYSTPKQIRAEWRMVCTKNEILSSSLYLYQSLRTFVCGAPKSAIEIAEKILANNLIMDILPPLFMIDVCLLETGQYKIIEINPINSSGFYANKRDKIVQNIIKYYDR